MEAKQLTQGYWLLRVVFGAVPIVAGLDKFTNLLTDWTQYLAPSVANLLPFSARTFMHVVGVVEIVAGALVLSKFTRIGAYVVALWLVGIAFNLLTTGHYFDVAVRDLVMAAGAFTLAKLEEVREQSGAHELRPDASLGRAHA
jgi:uncharacterized membrane protein YphA (DoxX/SURF4 family)